MRLTKPMILSLGCALHGLPSAATEPDLFSAAMAAAAQGHHGQAAASFFRLANDGDGAAAYNMAVLFATGHGVPQSTDMALYWAWRARLAAVRDASHLIARLTPLVEPERQTAMADRLGAAFSDAAKAGDGAAMLQLAAVLAHARPEPDLQQAYAWQALAAMLDIPGAVAARDASLLRIAASDRTAVQEAAWQFVTTWCAEKRTAPEALSACSIVAATSG